MPRLNNLSKKIGLKPRPLWAKKSLSHRRGRGEGGGEQREQALPALRNMGMKPRPSLPGRLAEAKYKLLLSLSPAYFDKAGRNPTRKWCDCI